MAFLTELNKKVIIDAELSETSENAVQNKAIALAIKALTEKDEDFTEEIEVLKGLESSGSRIKTLTDRIIRIWDLDEGVYLWDYKEDSKVVHYKGATALNYEFVSKGTSLVIITSLLSPTGEVYEKVFVILDRSDSYGTKLITGGTGVDTGEVHNTYLDRIRTPAYSKSQRDIGFYYDIEFYVTSLNNESYLVPGEYGIGLSASGTVANGLPYILTENRRAVLKTLASCTYASTTYTPTIKQDLFIAGDDRTFTRFVTYASSSDITWGQWYETTASSQTGLNLLIARLINGEISAPKATADSKGNKITDIYATKEWVNENAGGSRVIEDSAYVLIDECEEFDSEFVTDFDFTISEDITTNNLKLVIYNNNDLVATFNITTDRNYYNGAGVGVIYYDYGDVEMASISCVFNGTGVNASIRSKRPFPVDPEPKELMLYAM